MVKLKTHSLSRENPAILAIVYAEIGDIETAFKLVHQGVQQKQGNVTFIFSEPWFFNLHGDPRWNELRVLLGFEKERLDAIEFTLTLPN